MDDEFYDKDSCDMLQELLSSTDTHAQDFGTYCPPPSVIRDRAKAVHWLYDKGFPEKVIESVMQREEPPVETVKMMIDDLGKSVADVCKLVECQLSKRRGRKEKQKERREMFERRRRRPKQ